VDLRSVRSDLFFDVLRDLIDGEARWQLVRADGAALPRGVVLR